MPGQDLREQWLRWLVRKLPGWNDVPERALHLHPELLWQELRQRRLRRQLRILLRESDVPRGGVYLLA